MNEKQSGRDAEYKTVSKARFMTRPEVCVPIETLDGRILLLKLIRFDDETIVFDPADNQGITHENIKVALTMEQYANKIFGQDHKVSLSQ